MFFLITTLKVNLGSGRDWLQGRPYSYLFVLSVADIENSRLISILIELYSLFFVDIANLIAKRV